jgi:6-phosphogluconate dehydrogenase
VLGNFPQAFTRVTVERCLLDLTRAIFQAKEDESMEIGMIGLGRMGGNMTERLLRGGHRVVGYTRNAEAVKSVVAKGAIGADSLPALVKKLSPPRAVWLMVPGGNPVDETIHQLLPHLSCGDMVIDGGNSNYKDSIRRAKELKEHAIDFVDVGTSGGLWGLTEGYCLMAGGDREAVERLKPIFETLAPQPDRGWGHVGPNGAGHFVKMIHNGIEYGLMQAYAEGLLSWSARPDSHWTSTRLPKSGAMEALFARGSWT